MDFAAPSSTLNRYRSGSSRCSQVSVAWSWQSPDLAVGDRTGLSTGALALRQGVQEQSTSWSWPPLQSGSRPAGPIAGPYPKAWDRGSSSPGLVRVTPPPFSVGASTPGEPAAEAADSPSGQGFHPPTSCSVRVVSHHLDGFLRTGAAGLLRPATGPGVRRVSDDSSLRSLRAEARNTAGV
jgi:hypothetical protein